MHEKLAKCSKFIWYLSGKYFLRFFFGGGGRILLPVVSYAYKFCVPPPLGLYFLCRLRFAHGRPKTPMVTQNASQKSSGGVSKNKKVGGTQFKFAQLILGKIIKIVATMQVSYFKAKMHQIRLRLGLRPTAGPGSAPRLGLRPTAGAPPQTPYG